MALVRRETGAAHLLPCSLRLPADISADVRAPILARLDSDVCNSIQGVAGLYDLLVWVTAADLPRCSAHVELGADAVPEVVRVAVATMLEELFGLEHVTIQIEREAYQDRDLLHP